MSSNDSATKNDKKKFAPSCSTIDTKTGEKFRLCAGAAVLNSKNELLVGERISIPGSWQAPQGGVDAGWDGNNFQEESLTEAATRELYEEIGLVVGKHVVIENNDDFVNNDDASSTCCRYRFAPGTDNWLTRAEYAGQELHWTIFRCIDGRGEAVDPSIMCDLSGLGGESAEFSNVKWVPLEQVIENMWPAKRDAYITLKNQILTQAKNWNDRCHQTDYFAGKWSRDNNSETTSVNLVEALIARGLDAEKAKMEACKPYIQRWARRTEGESIFSDGDDDNNNSNNGEPLLPSWIVTTYADDGKIPRRQLHYRCGEWEELYRGNAVLFGPAKNTPQILRCRTFYCPETDADSHATIAHVTIRDTPKGDLEESRRYMKNGQLILRRTFWSKEYITNRNSNGVVSQETFRLE